MRLSGTGSVLRVKLSAAFGAISGRENKETVEENKFDSQNPIFSALGRGRVAGLPEDNANATLRGGGRQIWNMAVSVTSLSAVQPFLEYGSKEDPGNLKSMPE